MLAAAYLWHNYGNTPIGARTDIENVPIERLQAFYQTYYQPDNAVLLVAGKFDEAEDARAGAAVLRRDSAARRARCRLYTVEPVQDGERLVTLRRVGDVQLAVAGYHMPPGSHPDFAAVADPRRGAGRRARRPPVQGAGGDQEGRRRSSRVRLAVARSGHGVFGAQVRTEQPLEPARDALHRRRSRSRRRKPVTERGSGARAHQLLEQIELTLNNSERVGLAAQRLGGHGRLAPALPASRPARTVKTADVQRVGANYFKPLEPHRGPVLPDATARARRDPGDADVAALVKDYKGDAVASVGEAFDPSPANIEARTVRTKLPGGLKLALLPKKTRGGAVFAGWRCASATEEPREASATCRRHGHGAC